VIYSFFRYYQDIMYHLQLLCYKNKIEHIKLDGGISLLVDNNTHRTLVLFIITMIVNNEVAHSISTKCIIFTNIDMFPYAKHTTSNFSQSTPQPLLKHIHSKTSTIDMMLLVSLFIFILTICLMKLQCIFYGLTRLCIGIRGTTHYYCLLHFQCTNIPNISRSLELFLSKMIGTYMT